MLALFAGLALPWLTACLLLAAIRQYQGHSPHPGRHSRLLGYGFFLGYALLFALIQTLDRVHGEVTFGSVMIPLSLVAAGSAGLLLYLRRSRPAAAPEAAVGPAPAAGFPTPLAVLLLAWAGLHLLFALADVLSIPVFPWDAWLVWLYRAKAWFYSGGLTEIVGRADWLAAGDSAVYTVDAHGYPQFLSVIGMWAALCLGRWSETLVNLPGYLAAIAIGLALYGHVARFRLPFTFAVMACYLLFSVPLFATHMSLGGYADLWMAGFAGLGFVALIAGLSQKIRGYQLLGLALIAFSVLVKNEGVVWLVSALGLYWLVSVPRQWQLATAAVFALLVAIGLVTGVTHVDLPGLGALGVKAGQLFIPGLGAYALDAQNVGPEYLLNFFALGSWNLLWLLILIGLIIACRRPVRLPQRVVLAFLGIFILSQIVIFGFSDQGEWASTFTAINRLPLQVLPALVFCVTLALGKSWQRSAQRGAAAAATGLWRLAAGAAVAAALVALAAVALLLRSVPDDVPEPLRPQLQFVMGSGERENGAVIVRDFEQGAALLSSGPVNFSADDYPLLRLTLTLPPGAGPESTPAFFWRRADQGGSVSRHPTANGGLIDLSLDPEWTGRVVEVGLLVPGAVGAETRLDQLALEARGLANQWQLTWQGWRHFEPWTLRSINFIWGGASQQRLYLPALVAAWAIVTLLLRLPPIRRGSAPAAHLVLVLLAAWMLLDLRWTFNQARQFGENVTAGLRQTDDERLAALPETNVLALIRRFRIKHPQSGHRRFILVGDLYEHEYYLQRAKYLLLPDSALVTERLSERIPPNSADYVMFVGDFAAAGTRWAEIRARLPASASWRDRLDLVNSEDGVLLFSVRR